MLKNLLIQILDALRNRVESVTEFEDEINQLHGQIVALEAALEELQIEYDEAIDVANQIQGVVDAWEN